MVSIKLRKVFKKDWDFILQLRNSDEFKNNFYNQEVILKNEHYNYLEKQKNNPKNTLRNFLWRRSNKRILSTYFKP